MTADFFHTMGNAFKHPNSTWRIVLRDLRRLLLGAFKRDGEVPGAV
jgi:hypothetical protein